MDGLMDGRMNERVDRDSVPAEFSSRRYVHTYVRTHASPAKLTHARSAVRSIAVGRHVVVLLYY